MIDEPTIERIKQRARIEEVVADFVQLRRRGTRYVGLCPFHDDRHVGNFSVFPPRNVYRCFACQAHGDSVDFIMRHLGLTFADAIRWLGQKYAIPTDMKNIDYKPIPQRPVPPPLPMLTLPLSMVTEREQLLADDNLVKWIHTINWDNVSRARIDKMLADYHIGHSRQGMTIFWQIDNEGRVRTGKMMRYCPDGHRDKSKGYNSDWIHSTLERGRPLRDDRGCVVMDNDGETVMEYPYRHLYDPEKQEMKQCLFGLHLLGRYRSEDTNQTVCIVESEKTALLMAIAYGNDAKQVWMACGGLQMLNAEKLEPLIRQHRRIVVYPDRDGIEAWQQFVARLHYDRIAIDVRAVTQWWRPEDGPKADIADVVVRIINAERPITTAQATERYPALGGFIKTMNLTPSNNEKRQLRTGSNEAATVDEGATGNDMR